MRKLNQRQELALADAIGAGRLVRVKGYENFQPGGHLGQTIASLINRGLMERRDKFCPVGYPTEVTYTEEAVEYFKNKK